MDGSALQRKNMVESQVRPSDVTDRRITSAMMRIPREDFVPPALAPLAYIDETLVTGNGAALLAPRDLARLIQFADVEENDKVLIVGTCGGYAAALLAGLCARVTVFEAAMTASERLKQVYARLSIDNVTIHSGPLNAGWKEGAPYNLIFIEGMIDAVSDAIGEQLAEGGRVVAIMPDNGVSRAVALVKSNGVFIRRNGFQAAGPVVPGFSKKQAFEF